MVAHKLAGFDGTAIEPGAPILVVGDDWAARVKTFLQGLSPVERDEVKATGVSPDGTWQAWNAVSAATFMERQNSPWLPRVLNDNAMFPYYQPIIEMETGRTIAFEALMRANVDGRLISGGELVDAARAHNALFQFDQKARTRAITHAADRVLPGELLFVNFTPMVIYDPAICLQTTWEAAQAAGWRMDKLVFEVVESEAFPDIPHLRHILDAYRERGCTVALDDIGTGHTALSYIEELRPDIIKIAKGLLPDRPHPDDLGLVRGLVEHAHNRGITALIEGVETPEQLEAAREMGIDLVQGYLLGRPAAEPVRPHSQLRMAA